LYLCLRSARMGFSSPHRSIVRSTISNPIRSLRFHINPSTLKWGPLGGSYITPRHSALM
jgi:hypothetical protein